MMIIMMDIISYCIEMDWKILQKDEMIMEWIDNILNMIILKIWFLNGLKHGIKE